jgi:hypothetical protein
MAHDLMNFPSGEKQERETEMTFDEEKRGWAFVGAEGPSWVITAQGGGDGHRFFGRATYGFHFTGVTANGVPLLELTQPAAVRLQGSFSG